MRNACVVLCLLWALLAKEARAFPGVCVGKDAAARFVHSAQIVLMQHAGVSVVTVAVDYEGPLAPFALILPVPADVQVERVRTVKRGLIARLDEVTAPRFHAFYEQDPCDGGRTEQRWEEKIRAHGRGFLAAEGLPPLDRRYAISNEISAPVTPVFKGAENEFRYKKLEFGEAAELEAWLRTAGYVIPPPALAALAPHVGKGKALLFAEVLPEHVELAQANAIELGGIRYSTEQLQALPVTLGLQNAKARQDLLVYVLDRKSRYEAANYENAFVPSNLGVSERAAAQIGRAYNALFESLLSRAPAAFVTEYAGSTRACGEPCADAPLGMDELLSFGGDVLEQRTASAKERAGEPALEEERDRAKFEERLAGLRPAERGRERREHARVLAELGRRRALMARQTYVLSRLHHRYAAPSLPRDLELRPAAAVRGGVGVPAGKAAALAHDAQPVAENQFQVRLVALHPWGGAVSCASPERHRWGKPWSSESRAAREVPLAIDLPVTPGDRELLLGLLTSPVPELGIGRSELRHAAARLAPPPAPSASSAPAAAPAERGCSSARPGRSAGSDAPGQVVSHLVAFSLLTALGRARRRARKRLR